jgi:hypothetical protein
LVDGQLDYLLERELKHQLDLLEFSVLKGNASDWADYRYLVGQICGIQFAMQVLLDLRQRTSQDGDLE